MDPLTIFNTYYKRDDKKFGELDDIIDFAENEFKAAEEFTKKSGNFDLIDDVKPPRDEKAGGGLSYLMGI